MCVCVCACVCVCVRVRVCVCVCECKRISERVHEDCMLYWRMCLCVLHFIVINHASVILRSRTAGSESGSIISLGSSFIILHQSHTAWKPSTVIVIYHVSTIL